MHEFRFGDLTRVNPKQIISGTKCFGTRPFQNTEHTPYRKHYLSELFYYQQDILLHPSAFFTFVLFITNGMCQPQ